MRKSLIVFVLLFIVMRVAGQDYQLVYTIPFNYGKFTTDPIGNCYIYSKGDITKFNPDGLETARYSSRDFGDISFVDATNALKIVVVFKEFSKAVILDAALAPQATIDLSFPGIPYVNVICSSRESGYWIVDPIGKQIRKLNDQLSIVIDGTPFRQVSGSEIEPLILIDSGNWLVLNTNGNGLLIFDRFGTYYKTIMDVPPVQFQANGHDLLYKDGTGMVKIDIRSGKTDRFLLPENKEDDRCRVEGNRIFIKSLNTLKIYTY